MYFSDAIDACGNRLVFGMIHLADGDMNRTLLLFASNRALTRFGNVFILTPFDFRLKGFFISVLLEHPFENKLTALLAT